MDRFVVFFLFKKEADGSRLIININTWSREFNRGKNGTISAILLTSKNSSHTLTHLLYCTYNNQPPYFPLSLLTLPLHPPLKSTDHTREITIQHIISVTGASTLTNTFAYEASRSRNSVSSQCFLPLSTPMKTPP